MPGHLKIICNTERLPALDTGDLKGFGMTLSVGWSEATAPDLQEALKPWLWGSISKIQFYWKLSNGTNTTPTEVDALPLAPSPVSDPFRTRLDGLYTASAADPKNFKWPQNEYSLNDSAQSRPWSALVNHVATYPFPLPQSCNLSRIFRVRIEGDELFAAPIIPKPTSGPFPAQKLTPAGTADPTGPISGKANIFKWKYDVVTPFETIAFVQSVSPTVSTVEFINFANQWLELTGVSSAASTQEDWQSDLEYRVAQGFQFTQFLLDFIRNPVREALLNTNDNLNRCIALALATLRDVAGPGANTTPEGIRFSQRLFEKDLTAAELAQITDTMWANIDQALFKDDPAGSANPQTGLQKWKNFLNDQLPAEAKDLFVLTGGGPPVAPTEVVAQLEKVFAQSLNSETGESPLWKIFRQQWSDALPGSGIPAPIATKIKTALAKPENLHLDLSRQLLLSHLGRFWADFTASSAATDRLGRELLTKCLPAFIRHYAELRLGLTGQTPTTGCVLNSAPTLNPPVPSSLMPGADLQAALKTELEDWIAKALAKASPNEPTKTTDVPHAMTFQASPMVNESGPTGREFDPLERISGVGVLMREEGKTEWLPLNLGEAFTDGQPLGLGPLVVPYRLHYRNNLRQVCFSYNNQPLIAAGPLAATDVTNLSSSTGASPDDLASYKFTTTRKIPGLKFGRQYQFALFAISNSGTLPADISVADEPWKLRDSITADPPAQVASVLLPYKRLVSIGSPRLFNVTEETTGVNRFKPLSLPKIPAGVTPLAKDIDVFLDRTSRDPNLDKRREQPILLLTPTNWQIPGVTKPDEFEFRVKVPGVGWECWDRWVAAANDPRREPVIADYFRQAEANKLAPQGSEKDLQLDDPAVVDQLFFILERERNGSLEYVGELDQHFLPINVPPNQASGLNDLVKAQKLSVRVKCTYEAAGALEGLGKGNEQGRDFAKLNVVRGTVYRLSICSAVRKSEEGRFGDEVLDRVAPPPGAPLADLTLVSATRFVIEAATPDLPTGTMLWDNLALQFQKKGSNWILGAKLEAAGGNFRFLHRAEIDRQVWRWTGRPSQTHPELERNFGPAEQEIRRRELIKWEAREFGERLDSELAIHNMLSEKNSVIGERKFLYDEILGDATSGKHKGLELRGLHFRFAVRAFSRYESILPAGTNRSVETIKVNDAAQGISTRWKSQFVPCRHTEELEAPKIKFMLPLTEGLPTEPSNSGGILVVLSEVWHQGGGIGEGIEAEIAMTPDPGVDPTLAKNFYFQVGPDPIVTADGRDETAYLEGDRPFEFRPLLGPIGHFYDVNSRASAFNNPTGFFVNTSFVLPAPTKKNEPAKKFPWYFAKVRLRRTQRTRLPVSDAAATAGYVPQDELWKRTQLASKFTDPAWVQFLPAFSIYDGADQLSNVTLNVIVTTSADGLTGESAVYLVKRSGENAVLKSFSSDNNDFDLYLVLTKRVFDVTGRNDQESYVGLFQQDKRRNGDPAKWIPAEAVTAVAGQSESAAEYIARIIEVQRPKLFGTATCQQRDNLWEELFGKTDNSQRDCDTRARIVRISAPIENKPVSSDVVCR